MKRIHGLPATTQGSVRVRLLSLLPDPLKLWCSLRKEGRSCDGWCFTASWWTYSTHFQTTMSPVYLGTCPETLTESLDLHPYYVLGHRTQLTSMRLNLLFLNWIFQLFRHGSSSICEVSGGIRVTAPLKKIYLVA